MNYGLRLTLAVFDAAWSWFFIFLVILQPVPLRWPALEEVKPSRAEEPKYHIDQIYPPGEAEPTLVYEEKPAIEIE